MVAKTKKAVSKKSDSSAAKKVAAPKKSTAIIKDPMTKGQIFASIVEETGLSKKNVVAVFDALNNLVERSVKPRAAGSFTLPGLIKITAVKKPARKARKGKNPFTGEETTFKAKPAHWVVKARALKKLKDMVEAA
jgi:nucleoid DNA-binding protein